ncbi:MAG: hypothetical protein VW644_02190 [Alphaproteobacteria bacterium]
MLRTAYFAVEASSVSVFGSSRSKAIGPSSDRETMQPRSCSVAERASAYLSTAPSS